MENGQTSLLDILPRNKGGRKTTKLSIPFETYVGIGSEDKEIWCGYRWWSRMKRLRNEMFSANITEAKSTYMEQIRSAICTSRTTTVRKMCSLHKPEDTRMDIQAG